MEQQTGAHIILEQCTGKENWKVFGAISYDRSVVIGTGSNNTEVFLGEMKNRGPVAVKKIKCKKKTLSTREIDILKSLPGHSNIVQFYDYAIHKNKFIFIAFELCSTTLEQCVYNRQLPLPLSKHEVLKQTATGLSFLHDNKIIHRDLKPANILISHDQENCRYAFVKLSDFGLSKVVKNTRSCATMSKPCGTSIWMSPEVAWHHEDLENGKKTSLVS